VPPTNCVQLILEFRSLGICCQVVVFVECSNVIISVQAMPKSDLVLLVNCGLARSACQTGDPFYSIYAGLCCIHNIC